MTPTPRQILEARGVYEAAIKLGWTETAHYWHYPVYSLSGEIITQRGKAYPNQDLPKYIWPDGKPENSESDYYIPKGAKEAIAAAGGVCYLANGEIGVAAFHAAGIYNVIATLHSEITVPKTLIPTLESLGISTLINIPDKDEAGLKAAVKWRDALLLSGVEYQAKQWPDYLPEKADFNDLWIALNFDAKAAKEALENCQALILPQPKTKKIVIQDNPEHTPEGLINTIASALGIQDWKADGFSRKNVHCLFHEDSEESAGFNRITGVMNCFACGSHSPRDVAERLGIDWKQYYPQREKKARKKPVRIEKAIIEIASDEQVITSEQVHYEMYATPAYPSGQYIGWINQDWLPLTWVKALLHLCHSKSATAVYAIRFHRAVRTAKINPESMTISDLQEILGSYDEVGHWQKAPRKGVQAFIDAMTTWGFFLLLATNIESIDIVTKSGKNLGGRPQLHYAINACTEDLRYKLAELLEPALLEHLTEKELAPRAPSFRDSLDLPFDEFRKWRDRTHSGYHDYVLHLIQSKVTELLESDFAYEFSKDDLAHPSKLRGRLLRTILAPYSRDMDDEDVPEGVEIPEKGIQLSRGKLSLELGCSASSLSKLYEENQVGVKRIRGWYEVESPNNCDILSELKEAPSRLNKDLGGISIGIKLKVRKIGKEKAEYLPYISYADKAKDDYEKWNGRIEKLYIWVEQPSLLWLMNADEIAAKAAKDAELLEDALEAAEDEMESAKILKKAEKAPRKKTTVAGKDRLFTGLDKGWIAEQIALEVHKYTPYKLSGLAIVDNQENVVVSLPSYKELVIWLNQNASTKALRSEYSYYNEEKVMASKKNAVYYIHCELLNKTYVASGADIDDAVKQDFKLLASKKHPCRALQAAYNEFGKDSLAWGWLEDGGDYLEGQVEYWTRKLSEDKPWNTFNQIA